MLCRTSKGFQAVGKFLSQAKMPIFNFHSFKADPELITSNLLSPFNKSQTLQALRQLHEGQAAHNKFKEKDLIILDELSSPPQSTTTRVFDQQTKVFAAEKTFSLMESDSWNQLNLILRQYHIRSPAFGQVLSINYDEKFNEVKVYTEIQNMILKDYAKLKSKQGASWTPDMLGYCTWQLLYQQHCLGELGATCRSLLNLENFYIDQRSGAFKLYDFGDFEVDFASTGSQDSQTRFLENLDRAVVALANILNPFHPVRTLEKAHDFLRLSYPEFLQTLNEFKTRLELFKNHDSVETNEYILAENKFNNSISYSFMENHQQDFFMKLFKMTLEHQKVPNVQDKLVLLNEALRKIQDDLTLFHSSKNCEGLTEKFSLDKYCLIQNQKKEDYLYQAKIETLKNNPKKAQELFRKASNIDHEVELMQRQSLNSQMENLSAPKENLQRTNLPNSGSDKQTSPTTIDKVLNSFLFELVLQVIFFPIHVFLFLMMLVVLMMILAVVFWAVDEATKWINPKTQESQTVIQVEELKPLPKPEKTPEQKQKRLFLLYGLALSTAGFLI